MKNEIILYRPNEITEHIEVRLENETVWLNRQQIALLFDRDIKTIGKHINNVFAEGELEEKATVAKFATVQNEGGRMVERQVEYYNLDVTGRKFANKYQLYLPKKEELRQLIESQLNKSEND